MKYLNLFKMVMLSLCLLFVSGCTQLKDFVNENPVVVSIAVRQAVVRYIDIGSTVEAKQKRSHAVKTVIHKIKTLIDTRQTITVSNLLEFTTASIKWESLSPADKMAVQDILLVIDMALTKDQPEINPETLVVINGLLKAADSATLLY